MGKNSELRDIPYGSPILAMATCVFGWMMDVKHNIFESAYVWESDIFWTFFERAWKIIDEECHLSGWNGEHEYCAA